MVQATAGDKPVHDKSDPQPTPTTQRPNTPVKYRNNQECRTYPLPGAPEAVTFPQNAVAELQGRVEILSHLRFRADIAPLKKLNGGTGGIRDSPVVGWLLRLGVDMPGCRSQAPSLRTTQSCKTGFCWALVLFSHDVEMGPTKRTATRLLA